MIAIKLGVHYMRKNSGSHKGLIICTSSNAGLYPFVMAPMYGIAKHGVVGAVRSLAPSLKGDGIQINALCPNCIGTCSSSCVLPLLGADKGHSNESCRREVKILHEDDTNEHTLEYRQGVLLGYQLDGCHG